MKGSIVRPVELQAEGHYLLSIKTDVKSAAPGQFVTVKINSTTDPLLRRPFSIFDFNDGVFDIIFQLVGKGTSVLSEYRNPDIDILAPLGNGFTLLDKSKVLLVGGGAGNAPLHFLARALRERGCNITQVYGSRTKSLIYCRDRFCSSCDEVIFTTDDGSEGEKGLVTHTVEKLFAKNNYDMVYICGPKPMIKGLAPLVESSDSRCEVSLENYFGCGTGICYGCTITTKLGNKRVCNDGPVFPFELLDFNLL